MTSSIRLKYCRLVRASNGAFTYFPDGTSSFNFPPDHPYYRQVASWCGFENLFQYNWEHEFVHSFLAEKMWDAPSPIVWNAAHSRKGNVIGSKYEERWVYHFQRFLRGISEFGEPEWTEWKKEALELLGG